MWYWLSFWLLREHMGFELHSPWWISGYRDNEKEPVESGWMDKSICCAVRASSEEEAKEMIRRAFDVRPVKELEWRFCEQQDEKASPFSSRFNKADWMVW